VRVAEPLHGMLLNGFARDADSAERQRKIAVDAEEEIGELREIGPAPAQAEPDAADATGHFTVLRPLVKVPDPSSHDAR
jgi:hypothetical protein